MYVLGVSRIRFEFERLLATHVPHGLMALMHMDI
jgi:hypothetical protein